MNTQTKISRRDALKLGAAAAAGAGLALAGVGPGASRVSAAHVSSPITLTLWTWGSTQRPLQAWTAVRSVYPNDFKNMKLHAVVAGPGDFDVAKSFRLALAAHKNIPDLIQFNFTQIPEFAQAGVLSDLSDIINPVKDDLYKGALEIASYNGKVVSVPYEVKSKLFYYRGDLFDQAGITVSEHTTLDDFIAAGRKFHAKFPHSYILNLGPQPAQYWLGEILSAYSTARMADKSGHYDLTTNRAFTDTFTFFKRIHDAGIAWPVDDFTTDWAQGFKSGTIGGDLVASWMKLFLPGYATTAQVGKWNASAWPVLSPLANQKYGSEAGGAVYVIPQGAPNPDAAKLFLTKWLLDKKSTFVNFQVGGVTPLLKSMKPEVLAYINHAKKPAGMSRQDWLLLPQNFFAKTNGKPYYEIELDSYDGVKVFPYDPQATKEVTILQQALFRVLAGKASVAKALAQAQSDMQSQIGNPYQS